jgi:hypothetical protein
MTRATATIELPGCLGEELLSELRNRDVHLQTLLVASVRDQAALHGLLQRIQVMGLLLVAMRRIDPQQEGGGSGRRRTDAHVEVELELRGSISLLDLSMLSDHTLRAPVVVSRLTFREAWVDGGLLAALQRDGHHDLAVGGADPATASPSPR